MGWNILMLAWEKVKVGTYVFIKDYLLYMASESYLSSDSSCIFSIMNIMHMYSLMKEKVDVLGSNFQCEST